MEMNRELAQHLAVQQCPGLARNKVMRKANEIFKANSDEGVPPFPGADIEFATFVDDLIEKGTAREKDLVYVSDTLREAWHVLHVSMAVLHEKPSPSEEETVIATGSALKRLGMLERLTDNLSKPVLKWLTARIKASSTFTTEDESLSS